MTVSEIKFVVPGEIQGATINNIIAPAENAVFKIDGMKLQETRTKISKMQSTEFPLTY